MVIQQKKPNKLQWTQSWRKANKKGKDESAKRIKKKKVNVVARGFVGLSVDELKLKRKATIPKVTNAATEAALKEVKDRKKNKSAAKNGPSGGGANVPKLQQKHK